VTLMSKVMEEVQRQAIDPARADFARAKAFEPKSRSYASVTHFLRDQELRGELLGPGDLTFNLMTLTPELDRKPVTGEQLSAFRERCERDRGQKHSNEDIQQALLQVAHEHSRHPVVEYLCALKWDGQRRIEHLATTVGAAPTALNRELLKKWLISAVARPLNPGCKVDTVLVLVGPQGSGKSTFFSTLGGSFHTETTLAPGEKDSFLALHASWIFEWAELESLQRARSSESVKAFISTREDLFRPPYARTATRLPTPCAQRAFLLKPDIRSVASAAPANVLGSIGCLRPASQHKARRLVPP